VLKVKQKLGRKKSLCLGDLGGKAPPKKLKKKTTEKGNWKRKRGKNVKLKFAARNRINEVYKINVLKACCR